MRVLRFLFFRRWRRAESAPIREEEAYARSYGMRTGEVLSVARMPEPEPAPDPETEPRPMAEPKAEAGPVPAPELEPEPVAHRTSGLTDELLRRAFQAKLDSRGRTAT